MVVIDMGDLGTFSVTNEGCQRTVKELDRFLALVTDRMMSDPDATTAYVVMRRFREKFTRHLDQVAIAERRAREREEADRADSRTVRQRRGVHTDA